MLRKQQIDIVHAFIKKQYNITLDELYDKYRCKAHISEARQVAYYILSEEYGWSKTDIGRWFGRYRNAVVYGVEKIKSRKDLIKEIEL